MKIMKIHPIFNREHIARHHAETELISLGDKYGTDFMVVNFHNPEGNKYWAALYENNGLCNDDWYGWNVDVLAPVSGVIKKVKENAIVNEPGIMTPGEAGVIQIETPDGENVVIAHIHAPAVYEGDTITAGQIIAKAGNNGFSRNPHVHVGAWKGIEPLAIEVDRDLLIEMYKRVGEIFWYFGVEEE